MPGTLVTCACTPRSSSPATPSAIPNGAARGALWDIGPHALSNLLPALGPVTHVVADRGLGDTVTVVLHHESGAASTMSLSLTAPPGSWGSTWQLFGEDRQTSMPEATPPRWTRWESVSQRCSRSSPAGGIIPCLLYTSDAADE